MYLLNTPNDKRTWIYPTYNRVVSFIPLGDHLELNEDVNGNIFIETYKDFFVRISSEQYKSKHSLYVKRYSVV
jgi:hypothetical protein